MTLPPAVKKMTFIFLMLILALSFSGCAWNNWPWSTKTEFGVESANQKLDTIAVGNDIINQQVSTINKRLAAIEKHLLEQDGYKRKPSYLKQQPMNPASVKTQTSTPPKTDIPLPAPVMVKSSAKSPPLPAPSVTPEKQYAQAYLLYQDRKREQAISAFESFLRDYPAHELADNAQYWIGETYYDGKMFPEAIEAFKKVVNNYPDKDKAPAALLKIGYSYLAVDDTEKATQYLRQVVTDYPFSDLVNRARSKLADLQPATSGPSDAFPSGG